MLVHVLLHLVMVLQLMLVMHVLLLHVVLHRRRALGALPVAAVVVPFSRGGADLRVALGSGRGEDASGVLGELSSKCILVHILTENHAIRYSPFHDCLVDFLLLSSPLLAPLVRTARPLCAPSNWAPFLPGRPPRFQTWCAPRSWWDPLFRCAHWHWARGGAAGADECKSTKGKY